MGVTIIIIMNVLFVCVLISSRLGSYGWQRHLCICVFVFLYLCVRHMGISFLISLNNPLFKNIPHVGSFWHFVICCICVFVYLCICVCVFVHETLGNISFDILGPRAFRKGPM